MAETAAVHLMKNVTGGYHPLNALPVDVITPPEIGAIFISPYAGVQVARKRATEWKDCTAQELQQKCEDMVACMLMTLAMHASVVSHLSGTAGEGRSLDAVLCACGSSSSSDRSYAT